MSIIKLRNRKSRLIFLTATLAVILFVFGAKLFLDVIYVPVILMYHSVSGTAKTLDGYDAKLNVSEAAFERQMRFLHDHRYKVIPLAELIERIKNGERIPRKTVAITFDDGLENNFLYAYPLLKKYNFPATIFVTTDFIGRKNFLKWEEIRDMQENNISIGSHTVSHPWLPSLSEEDIKKELVESKKVLEDMAGRKVETFSYPIGAFDERVVKAVQEAGYIGAVGTNPGKRHPRNNPYVLKRIRISMTSNNLIAFWIETSGYYTFIKEHRDED